MKSSVAFRHRIFIFRFEKVARTAISLFVSFFIFVSLSGCSNLLSGASSSYTNRYYHPGVASANVPTPVTAFTVNSVTTSVALSWSGAGGAAPLTYTLLRSQTSGSGYLPIATGLTATNYTDASVNVGTTYYYVLQTNNAYGPSENSTEVSAGVLAGSTFTWPFTAGTDPSYSFDSNKVELLGGVIRLKNQAPGDHSNSSYLGFAAGSLSGLTWDGVNSKLKLDPNYSSSELSSVWTPKYSNLIGYWNLNGTNGNAIPHGTSIFGTFGPDAIAFNPNGTGMAYSNGELNQAVNFDGVDDQISIPNSTFLSFPSDSFSISGWFKSGSAGTRTGIYRHFGAGGAYVALFIAANDKLWFESEDSNAVLITLSGGSAVHDNYWHHFMAVRDKAGALVSLYLDGKLIASNADVRTGNFNNNSPPVIGHDTTAFFTGALDEIAIWTASLSATEVKTIYERQSANYTGIITSRVFDAGTSSAWSGLSWLTTLPFGKELTAANETAANYSGITAGPVPNFANGLAGLWHFDETPVWHNGFASTNHDFLDSSGNGNDLAYWGGTAAAPVPGRFGNALYRIGAGSGNASTLAVFPMSNVFTYSFWIKLGNETPFNGVTAHIVSSTSRWTIQTDGTATKIYTRIDTTAGANQGFGTTSAINDGNWHQYVLVVNNGTVLIYQDGTQITNSNFNLGAGFAGSAMFFVSWGNVNTGEHTIDEAAYWTRVLTPVEVSRLYQRGANRIKFQARTCTAPDCSDDPSGSNWRGNDGTSNTYFSEMNNLTASLPNLTPPGFVFSNFGFSLTSNQYYQYRAILESDVSPSTLTPDLTSVSAGGNKYDGSKPEIIPIDGPAYLSLTGFNETLGAGGCTGTPKYQLSKNKTTWYYYSGGTWTAATDSYSQASDAITVNANISLFPAVAGTGNLYVKVFLPSDTTTACEIDSLSVNVGSIASSTSSNPKAFQLTSITDGAGQVSLAWSASAGATSYTVCYGTSAGACTFTFAAGGATSATINGLTNGTQYYFYVVADNGGASTSTPNSFTAIPAAAPSVPAGVTASSGYSHINLAWTASTGAGPITYNVLRSTVSGAGYVTLATGISTPGYTDLTSLNGTAYYYVITASNGGSTSANSIEVTATSLGSFTVTPTAAANQVTLTWTAAPGAAAGNYTIKYGTSSGVYSSTLNAQTSPKTIGALTNGTTYYFMVIANNASGASYAAAEVSAIPHYVLATTAGPNTLDTGKCSSSAYTITSKDVSGGIYNQPGNLTITLTGGTGITFYAAADTTCAGAPITTAIIGTGTSTVSFYAKTNIAQTMSIGATATGYLPTALTVTSSWNATRFDLFAGKYVGVGHTDGTGSAASFNMPYSTVVDAANHVLYVADSYNNAIRKIDLATNAVTTLAGTVGTCGRTDANGTSAVFCVPQAISYDGARYLYVGDARWCNIRKVDTVAPYPVTTITGSLGCSSTTIGDGTAAGSYLSSVQGVLYYNNKVYVTDTCNTIRMIDLSLATTSNSYVTTISGTFCTSGLTDANGTAAQFYSPIGLATDGTFLYVSDFNNNRIAKVTLAAPYTVTTMSSTLPAPPSGITLSGATLYIFARNELLTMGTGATTFTNIVGQIGSNFDGDVDASGLNAGFYSEYRSFGISNDGTYVYLPDTTNHSIKKIQMVGPYAVTTIAGTGNKGNAVTNGVGTAAAFTNIVSSATDGTNLYVSESSFGNVIRKISIATGTVSTLAGIAKTSGCTDGVLGTAKLNSIRSLAYYNGFLFAYDEGCATGVLRKIDVSNGTVSTIAGTAGLITNARSIAVAGNTLFIGSSSLNKIFTIDLSNAAYPLVVLAGTGASGDDAGAAATSRIGSLAGMWADSNNVYFFDLTSCRIKKIDYNATKTISYFAGNGVCSFPEADGVGVAAKFSNVQGYQALAGDGTSLYILDQGGTSLRKILLSNATVSTVAGDSSFNMGTAQNHQLEQDGPISAITSANLVYGDTNIVWTSHGLFFTTLYGIRWFH